MRYSEGNSGLWTDPIFAGTTAVTTIDGLTNYQSYQVQVRASAWPGGDSDWSPIATGTPSPQVPQPPDALDRPTLTPGDGTLKVSWSPPSTNGALISGFKMRYRPGNSGDWRPYKFGSVPTTGTTIWMLINGQSYQVQVGAISSAGDSRWSPIATGTPQAPQAPDAPGRPTLTPGNGTLEVSWTAPSDNGNSITRYDVRYSEGNSGLWADPNFVGTGTITTIHGLTNDQSYQVKVRASNWSGGGGDSDWSPIATGTPTGIPVAEPPDAPGRPTLTPGNGKLEVSWSEPSANGAPISDYDVRYSEGNSGLWADPNFVGTGTSTTIDGLTNDQSYQVKVRAISSAGDSDWSPIATGTPTGIPVAEPPDAPGRPTLTPGNGKLEVSWSEPSDNGDSITRYDVRYRAAGSRGSWTDHSFAGTGTSTTIDGLTNGQSYRVRVRAVNSVGPSGWSPRGVAEPAAQAPDAPGRPTVNPGDSKLEVSWSEPAENGASISDYDVRYQPTSAINWTDLNFVGVGTSTTITGLTNGLNYTVQVRATNSAGPSDWSPIATGTPAAQAPDAPGRPTLTPGNRKLEVSWSARADNGASISDYDVRYQPTSAINWTDLNFVGVGTGTTITGLTNGLNYTVQVRATNSAGRSDWSTSATGTPAAQAPDAPDRPTLTPGNGKLEVSWSPPSTNGASISGYKLQYSEGNNGVWKPYNFASTSTTTSIPIPMLINGQPYQVQVGAISSAGDSDWSPIATGTPVAQAPDAPGRPTLTPGNAELEVSWTAPADNGASISDYDVRYQPTSAINWTDLNFVGVGTSTTITGLTNGLNYTVQVRATNSAGRSDWSTSATGTPAAQAPDAPDRPTLAAGNGKLEVSWSPPSTNGASISGYKLQYSEGNNGVWKPYNFASTSTTTSIPIPMLINGQPYQVQVGAISSAGDSDWSESATGTPAAQAPDAPGRPTVNPSNAQLEVSWTAPSDNGDSIIDYDVRYRAVGSSAYWTDHIFAGTGTSTTIDGLTNGQSYWWQTRVWTGLHNGQPLQIYVRHVNGERVWAGLHNGQSYQVQVRATNSAGPSDWSPIATGTPEAQAPDAPDRPTLTPGNGKLEVSWSPPSTNGASISGYKLQYSEGNNGVWKPYNFASTSTTTSIPIPMLINGQPYQVQVRTISSAGDSDWSPIATGTPVAQAPDAPGRPTLTPGNAELEASWTAPADNGASISDYDVRYQPKRLTQPKLTPGRQALGPTNISGFAGCRHRHHNFASPDSPTPIPMSSTTRCRCGRPTRPAEAIGQSPPRAPRQPKRLTLPTDPRWLRATASWRSRGARRPPTALPSPATNCSTARATTAFGNPTTLRVPPPPAASPSPCSSTASLTKCRCGRSARPAPATGRRAPRAPR